MLIYIIRHGETQANIDCIIQGWGNAPLNDYGIVLAKAAGRGLRGVRFDACYSSPLIRAVKTAEIVLKESGNATTPIELDDRLKEIHLGDWEGKTLSEMAGNEQLACYFHEPESFLGFPHGETLEQVRWRTQSFLWDLLAHGDANSTYLVATHGCAYRAMLQGFYNDGFWHGQMPPNCVVSVIRDGELVEDDRLYFSEADIPGYHAGRL